MQIGSCKREDESIRWSAEDDNKCISNTEIILKLTIECKNLQNACVKIALYDTIFTTTKNIYYREPLNNFLF